MKDNLLPLIMENGVSELSKHVFAQKLSQDSCATFTLNLSEEDENAVVKQLLTANGGDEWLIFLKKYLQHYPFFRSSDYILLDNSENANAFCLIIASVKRYGYSEEFALRICNYAEKQDDEKQRIWLTLLCENCHMFSVNIYRKLELIDFRREEGKLENCNFAQLYSQGVEAYRKSNGVFNHVG